MNKAKVLPLLAVTLLLLNSSIAQHYFTKSYTVDDGLPTRNVNDICQDKTGRMWFATQSGISSFDGFQFKNYDSRSGIPRQHFRKMKFDQKGTLWAVPDRLCDSIIWQSENTWHKILPATQRDDIEINTFDILYLADKPVICVGSTAGLDIFRDGTWNHIQLSADRNKNYIFQVIAKGKEFYLLTLEGIFTIDPVHARLTVKDFYKPSNDTILAMAIESPGSLGEKFWMLTSTRVSVMKSGMPQKVASGFSLPSPSVTTRAFLNIDSKDNIFFGNSWAKFFMNRKLLSIAPLMVGNGFSSNGASSMFIDREQNAWFADTRGVDKLSSLLQVNYFEHNGLLDNEVTAILELADGRMVFGHNSGLSLYDHKSIRRIRFKSSNKDITRVLDLTKDDQGNVWIAANSLGFGKMKPDGSIVWYPVEGSSMATTVFMDAHGKIWMGTNRSLFYLKNDRLVPFEFNHKINSPFRKIFSNRKGELIGTWLYGLYIISGDSVRQVQVSYEHSSQSVYAYYQDRSGTEFVGTLNGLCIIEHGRIRKFDPGGTSINCPVYFIFEDDNRNYWFGTDNGVLMWDGKNKVEIIRLQNGLAGRETNRSAGMVDSRGNVWIGTDKGLSCFLPGFPVSKPPVPTLLFLDFEDTRGVSHDFYINNVIGYTDNTLTFNFRGISFVNEELLNYRFKLVGFDNDWQYTEQHTIDRVKYAGLAPGKYSFIVQARNGAGAWSEPLKSGNIIISAPVWEQWWFILVVLILLVSVVYGIFKLIVQKKYSLKLEIEIIERKNSEQKALKAMQSLHESELRYKELIEFAVDGILIGSKDGVILVANTYMQHLTGRSVRNLIGLHVSELFSHDQLNDIPLRFDRIESGDMVVSRRNVLHVNGTLIPVEMHTKMMPDGTYQSIYHDITKRKQAENQLKESRELYKLITDKMTDVVWLMDLNGTSVFVSPSIEQFTGFSVEEYLHQTIDDRFAPDSAKYGKALFGSEITRLTQHPELLTEFSTMQWMEYVCKNGGTRWGEVLMTPYMNPEGEWIGIHGVTRDITDRKRSEEELKDKAAELQRFNSLMIGREMKMIELKKEINGLLKNQGKPEKYNVYD